VASDEKFAPNKKNIDLQQYWGISEKGHNLGRRPNEGLA
jgi:hypothetical protein